MDQDARVLSLEEIHVGRLVWIELDELSMNLGYAERVPDRKRKDHAMWFFGCGTYCSLPLWQHGNYWRCWNTKPSADQMKNTEWNESNEINRC